MMARTQQDPFDPFSWIDNQLKPTSTNNKKKRQSLNDLTEKQTKYKHTNSTSNSIETPDLNYLFDENYTANISKQKQIKQPETPIDLNYLFNKNNIKIEAKNNIKLDNKSLNNINENPIETVI
eukprot:256223_1